MRQRIGVGIAAAALLAFALPGAAQKPASQAPLKSAGQRDLRVEPDSSAPAPPVVSIPRSYALIIGISSYPNLRPDQQLHYSDRDAEAIYSILISPEGGNFPAENVHKLTGSKATLANMRHELEQWLPSVSKPDDRVLIYFAGHGFVYGGRGWLAPYDFDIHNIAGTGYAMDQLGTDVGSEIHGKWKVLLTDACHSGAITPETDPQTLNKTLGELNPSLFSLTASRDRERSFESADWGGGHGIFTYYVVKGLEGLADANRDGIVTADELAEYVHTNVRDVTKGQQNPTSEKGSFDPSMLLAYVPSNREPGAPPPPKFGSLVIESNMDGVEVFVNGKSQGIVNKDKPLTLPGQKPGALTIQGVKMGYEPDGPREEMVYPGQSTTITIKILIPRRRPRAAVEHFDKGLAFYTRGEASNYKAAVAEFQQALSAEPDYSEAALYLGRTYNALYDEENAAKFFQQALKIDPDYTEASASYAGMLLDTGDLDEAVRQLNRVVGRDAKNSMAWYLLAQALCRKEAYAQSIEAAQTAIRLAPNNGEAHFWLAESLRLNGGFGEARGEYANYLRLSNFDNGVAGKLNYYVLGYLAGIGKKKRASQADIWRDLRSWAYFGLCDSERKLDQFVAAIGDCQKSLAYDKDDPLTHYAIALCYARLGQQKGDIGDFAAARTQFQQMIDLNPNLSEADYAKKNIASIDRALAAR
jgi:tetratricopeptide (TPR) repeat protein